MSNSGKLIYRIFFFFSEHTCSIIMWLFRNLSGNLKGRLVQKFVENDHIKVDRLMELHFKYYNKIQECDAKIEREKKVGVLLTIACTLSNVSCLPTSVSCERRRQTAHSPADC